MSSQFWWLVFFDNPNKSYAKNGHATDYNYSYFNQSFVVKILKSADINSSITADITRA